MKGGTFYLTGNKSIQLLLMYAEKLKENGVDVKIKGYDKFI